ncbi:hypothetical protein IGI04_003171 [Brassica rapa subsp. trilocularis]|uniref:Uncharacterized protein n=1 Tax=Brassica rapa subsp. trilocularis TaxID=1813537 RepID=A0ABQ7P115_BRACM|nr:hypothetical protein IGI04_003171 [Brassica rapa subsp. trilocularis]
MLIRLSKLYVTSIVEIIQNRAQYCLVYVVSPTIGTAAERARGGTAAKRLRTALLECLATREMISVAFCIHESLSGIGVPHGVLGDTWRHLELKKECLEWSLGEQGMRATSPERHHQVALISLSERPYQSDREKSLAFWPLGDARTSTERPLAATQRGRSRSLERLTRATGRSRSRFHHSETRERARSDLSQRHSEVAPEAWSDLSERRAEVAARFISARTCDFSRAFWSFHYARFYFLNLCFNTLRATKRRIIFVLRKNHQKPLESHLFESIDHSKLDHPRSNPYIHEFSFPIVKKFKNSSKSLVALRLSDYLHSRCFDISQNWFDNHLYYNICPRSLENS